MTTSAHSVEVEGKTYTAYVSTTTILDQPEPCPCGEELGYRWEIELEQLRTVDNQIIDPISSIGSQVTEQLRSKLGHNTVACLLCRLRDHGGA